MPSPYKFAASKIVLAELNNAFRSSTVHMHGNTKGANFSQLARADFTLIMVFVAAVAAIFRPIHGNYCSSGQCDKSTMLERTAQ